MNAKRVSKAAARKAAKKVKANKAIEPTEDQLEEHDSGPGAEDGPEFEGYDGRTSGGDSAGSEADPFVSPDTESDAAATIPNDADGYLDPDAIPDPEEGTVVVQDFDPTDPEAPLAEPTKVLKPHDRIARKREQRKPLDKG